MRLKKQHAASMSSSFAREVLAAYAGGQESPQHRGTVRDILFGNEPSGSRQDHPCCVLDFNNGENIRVVGPRFVLLLGSKVRKHIVPEDGSSTLVVEMGFPNPRNDKENVSTLRGLSLLKELLLPYVGRA